MDTTQTAPRPGNEADGESGPSSAGGRRSAGRGRAVLIAVLAVSALAWAGVAIALGRYLPQRAWQQDAASLQGTPGLDAAVARFCTTDEGRDELLAAWEALGETTERRRLELALFHHDCLGLLPPESRHRFLRDGAGWALAELDPAGEESAALLVEALQNGGAEEQRGAARALLGRTEVLGRPDLAAAVYRAALAHMDQDWAIDLLDEIGTREAVGAALGRYLATPVTATPSARLQRLVLSRWSQLPDWARGVLVRRWLSARWAFRRGGALKQPQPVGLEVSFAPPPNIEPLAGAVACVRATSFLLDDAPLIVDGKPVVDQVGGVVLEDPGAWLGVADISSTFLVHGKHTIVATAEVALLPAAARGQTVVDAEGHLLEEWRQKALLVETQRSGPRSYRVYLGVDYGGPETLHDRALDDRMAALFDVVWSTGDREIPLRRGGALVTERPKIDLVHGGFSRIVLRADGPVPADQGLRIQALRRDVPKAAWVDIGEAVIRDNTRWPASPPAQLPITLAEVCPFPGPCPLELRLRSSLRVARTDPRIESYWGETLPLGSVVVEVANTADGHHWPRLHQRLQEAVGGAP